MFFSSKVLDTTDGPSSNKKLKLNDDDLKIKAQNKTIFKYRDYLKTLRVSECKELLLHNKQKVPESDHGAVC